ncbi:MAG: hypothetical protein LCH77_13900 [Actinobacteria bacterium]|uniref:RiboL-PSP-HEPN domain-containing protein n=1 Tax=Nostocoides veronense TaxID=330836 RepID=A0ABN2LU42_9MICO|nr:hypothetical protein [Actinomycetota bacterium]
MASVARDSFLSGIRALEDLCAEPIATDMTARGSVLRRGLVVSAYNLLETFVMERTTELLRHAGAGPTQFTDLNEGQRKKALRNMLQVASARVFRGDWDLSSLGHLAGELGASLSPSGGLGLHPYAFLWEGSNMSPDGLRETLRMWHVKSPFEQLRLLSGALGFDILKPLGGGQIDLKEDLKELMQMRHRCAHDSSAVVSGLELRAIPNRILRVAAPFDVLASSGAQHLRVGTSGYLADDDFVSAPSIEIRVIEARSQAWALLRRSGSAAERVMPTVEPLVSLACTRTPDHGVVVVRSLQREVVTWTTVGCG